MHGSTKHAWPKQFVRSAMLLALGVDARKTLEPGLRGKEQNIHLRTFASRQTVKHVTGADFFRGRGEGEGGREGARKCAKLGPRGRHKRPSNRVAVGVAK